jgi:hypothetical protein
MTWKRFKVAALLRKVGQSKTVDRSPHQRARLAIVG